jgi:hypothetical protein
MLSSFYPCGTCVDARNPVDYSFLKTVVLPITTFGACGMVNNSSDTTAFAISVESSCEFSS